MKKKEKDKEKDTGREGRKDGLRGYGKETSLVAATANPVMHVSIKSSSCTVQIHKGFHL